MQSSTQDGAIRELSVLANPSNEQSTKIKQKIGIVDYPNNLIEVLCADEGEENSMTYNSESGGSDKSSNNATDNEEEAWKNGCRDLIIIDKLTYSTSNIKEHKLSSNNLDTVLHDAHLLNTLRKPSIMVKKTKSKKKLKHKHFSPIIFVKLVIPGGKKGRQSKTRLVKSLVNSGASEYILAKAKADKLPVNKTKKEQQWSTAAGVLTTNTTDVR